MNNRIFDLISSVNVPDAVLVRNPLTDFAFDSFIAQSSVILIVFANPAKVNTSIRKNGFEHFQFVLTVSSDSLTHFLCHSGLATIAQLLWEMKRKTKSAPHSIRQSIDSVSRTKLMC